jgi:hypothetical protein
MAENYKDRFLKFISNPLFIGVSFSLYAFFIRFFVFPRYSFLLLADSDLIESFIEWFGVAYGLFIALVLVNVWAQFNTTEREFDREADAIFMLYQSIKQVKETRRTKALKREIITGIKAYVAHVTNYYEYEHQKLMVKDAGDRILVRIRDFIGELIHTDERASITSELVKEFNEAVDLRGDRISHSKQHIPDPVWGISLASSILWLIPFYGLNFINDWVAVILVGGVTIIVVAILVIIKDLDDPFEGTWRINISEWEVIGEKIELKPTLLFIYNLDSSRFSVAWAFINKIFSKRLCALHSLLGKSEQQQPFFKDLAGSAYLKAYYKDEFENHYEKIDVLPVVVYKSNDKMDIMIDSVEISEVTMLTDLNKTIRERLIALRA